MFYGSGKMNHDIQSEILSRNLSSFWKLRTHSQHLKMDVHIWCPIYISMLLISTICCDIQASIQLSHFLSFHCLSFKLCNELVTKIYLMVTACGQRFNIISFLSFTGRMSEAYFWRGTFVNLQPSGFMLRTKQNLALICFSHFHMFASKLSINDKTACLKTWFSCGRTRSFHYFLESSRSLILLSRTLHLREVCVKFSRSVVSASWWPKQPTALRCFTCKTTHYFIFPDKLPIFLSLFSWTCPLLLQSL